MHTANNPNPAPRNLPSQILTYTKRFAPVALIAAYPLLVHLGVVLRWPHLQLVAMLSFLLGIFWLPLSNNSWRAWACFIVIISLLLILAYFHIAFYLLYFPPIIFPLALLFVFGRTLLPGREALITAIGEAARGPLSPAMRRYSKNLTILWCAVFLGMAVWSALLPWLDQPKLWSWFTNFINYGFVGVLFVGEFILRKKLFPEHNHPSFIEYIQIIVKYNIRR